jgi:hypothetical protein
MERLKGRGHLEDPGVDENIILKRIKKSYVRVCGLHLCGSG